MVGVANDDLKRMLRTMMPAAARRRIADDLAGLVEIDIRSALLVAAIPTADADHLVVFPPLAESIVRRMHDDKSAASFHVVHECRASFLRPRCAVVVREDDRILAELRLEAGIGPLLGGGRDRDFKQAGL